MQQNVKLIQTKSRILRIFFSIFIFFLVSPIDYQTSLNSNFSPTLATNTNIIISNFLESNKHRYFTQTNFKQANKKVPDEPANLENDSPSSRSIVKNGFLRPQIILNKETNDIINTIDRKSSNSSTSSHSNSSSSQHNNQTPLQPRDNSPKIIKTKPNTNQMTGVKKENLLGSSKAREAFLERLKLTETLKSKSGNLKTGESESKYKKQPQSIEESPKSVKKESSSGNSSTRSVEYNNGQKSPNKRQTPAFYSPDATINNEPNATNARPFDAKNNFSSLVKIDIKFKSDLVNAESKNILKNQSQITKNQLAINLFDNNSDKNINNSNDINNDLISPKKTSFSNSNNINMNSNHKNSEENKVN